MIEDGAQDNPRKSCGIRCLEPFVRVGSKTALARLLSTSSLKDAVGLPW